MEIMNDLHHFNVFDIHDNYYLYNNIIDFDY